ncbi:MAG: transglutaminase family protein [Vulcanimicrobiota bacterium]
MTESSPFPHLLKLLDDPSEVVRVEVRKALLPLAPEIAELLKIFPAEEAQLTSLESLLLPWRKAQLLAGWPRWRTLSQPQERLEAFHQILCDFEYRWRQQGNLRDALDELTASLGPGPFSLEGLPMALFQRFQGDTEDYYASDNSFLCRVLQRGLGNPISLCSLLMLVGRRLGLDYRGCSFPGHFLARFQADSEQEPTLVDCFRGGRLLDVNLTAELRGDLPQTTARELARKIAPVDEIAARVLRNLVAAYVRAERRSHACLFDLLLKDLVARGRGRGQSLPLREPLFCPGQVVRHRKKAYRGVVIDYELYSDEEELPHLPLYRILVHGSPQVASADESQLELDDGGLVAHQLVGLFFSRFEDGVYVRNTRPWEGA